MTGQNDAFKLDGSKDQKTQQGFTVSRHHATEEVRPQTPAAAALLRVTLLCLCPSICLRGAWMSAIDRAGRAWQATLITLARGTNNTFDGAPPPSRLQCAIFTRRVLRIVRDSASDPLCVHLARTHVR